MAVDPHAQHTGGGHHAGQSDGQADHCSCESGLCGLSAIPHAYLPATSEVRVEAGVEASSPTVRFASHEVVPGERTQPPAIGPPQSI
jgi:hypothetical protein